MNTPPASVQRNIPGGGDISMCYFTSGNHVKDVDMQDVSPPSIDKSRQEKKFVISNEEFAKLSALAKSNSSPFTILKEKKETILIQNGQASSSGNIPKVASLQKTSNQKCIRISPKITSQATSSPVIQTLKSGSKINKVIIVQPGEDIEKVTAKAVDNITDELNKKAADKLAKGESPSQETVIEITRICAPAEGYFDREALQQKKRAALAQASTAATSLSNSKQTKTMVVPQSPAHHHHAANQQQSASSKLKSNQFTNVKLLSNQIKQEPSTPIGTETIEKLNDSLTNIQWLGKMSGDKVSTSKDTKIIASEEQVNQIAKECGRKKRPPFSYMHLIQMAISSREDKKMTLKEIYKWIEDKFPYYKYCVKQGWKNSIRHNLSLYDIFVRKKSHETQGQTGSSYWTLKPDVDLKIIYRPNSDSANESTANSQTLPILPIVNQVSAAPVIMVQTNQTANIPQNPVVSKPKKGPALLLPKPPPTQTFALIPIQSGIPVIPQNPMVVTGWSHQQTGVMSKNEKSFTDIKSKGGVKRIRKTSESGPIRKQVKIAPKGLTSDESISLLSPPQTSSFLSSQGNTSSLDTSELGKQLSQMKFDSGIDLKSCSDLSMSDVSGLHEQSAVSSALPKPKMYRQKRPRKEKQKVRHDLSFSSGSSEKGLKTPPYQRNETTPKQSKVLSIKDGAIHATGLGDILKSIEKDLTSPARQLLQTPDKAKNKGMLTSTPTKEGITSPSWISPIKGLTPMSGDHANLIDSGIFTPGKDGKVHTSTPFQTGLGASPSFKDLGASPPFKNDDSSPRFHFSSDKLSPRPGSLRSLGLPGLTPLKGQLVLGNPEDSPNGSLKNDSFMRIFDGVPLESFMDDDVQNLSFGSLS